MNLSETQKKWIAWIVVTVVITAVSVGLGVSYPLPPAPLELLDQINKAAEAEEGFGAQGVARPVQFRSVRITDDLTVADDVTITDDVTVDTITAATGATVTAGGIDVAAGGLSLGGLAQLDCTTSAITSTQTLTPTASCYLLSGTSTLTLTLGTVTTGTMALFVRTGNADLVLASVIKTSDSDLNQYDSFLALYDGSEWVQVGVSAN